MKVKAVGLHNLCETGQETIKSPDEGTKDIYPIAEIIALLASPIETSLRLFVGLLVRANLLRSDIS